MSDDPTSRMYLYKLYLATAEKVSDRRAAANTWMLSVNSAIVGFYGYLAAGKTPRGDPGRGIWLLAIPAAGILVCLAWAALLASYSKLNAAKFKVLQEIEEGLPFPVFRREQEVTGPPGDAPCQAWRGSFHGASRASTASCWWQRRPSPPAESRSFSSRAKSRRPHPISDRRLARRSASAQRETAEEAPSPRPQSRSAIARSRRGRESPASGPDGPGARCRSPSS